MRAAARVVWLEAAALLSLAPGCRTEDELRRQAAPTASASSQQLWQAALAPRNSGRFECDARRCRQEHPRLPDSGEWTCAERDRVVWCVGGEPAAGVVSGRQDAHFRCGPRWGPRATERVCIDEHPEFPDERRTSCRFEQESGLARVCGATGAVPPPPREARGVPGCWFDKDCASGACDRGVCACRDGGDCERGACEGGLCVESKP